MLTAIAIASYAGLLLCSIMALMSYIRKTKQYAKYLFFAGLCCLIIFFSLIIVPHMKTVQAAKENQATKPMGAYAKSQVSVGEDGVINEDAFVSLGEEMDNFNTMQGYIIANDREGLKRMLKLGKIYLAEKGTRIYLISKSFVRAKVEISGTGRVGLVPTAYLSKEE